MIKGTSADCKIKSITVSDSTAAISCILYSLSPAIQQQAFKFYLRDKDLSKPLIELSENIYWIDRLNNYNNDVKNVDVNQYKELLFKVDITNSNAGDLKGNRWIRNCNLVLRNIKDPINDFAWVSEDLTLVSKEFEIPRVENLDIFSNKAYNLFINFNLKYSSHTDFNYNNSSLYSTIQILSPFTDAVLETLDIAEENFATSKVSAKCLNSYTAPVKIIVQIKNIKGDVLKTLERLYTPIIKETSTYVKTSEGIKKVIAFYVKDDTVSNDTTYIKQNNIEPRLNLFKSFKTIESPKEETSKVITPTTKVKVNLNAVKIKTDHKLEPPVIKFTRGKGITFTNPNTSMFQNNRMVVYLEGIPIIDTHNKVYDYNLDEDIEKTYTFTTEIEGSISFLTKTKTFKTTIRTNSICSNMLVCSNTLYCLDDTGGQ